MDEELDPHSCEIGETFGYCGRAVDAYSVVDVALARMSFCLRSSCPSCGSFMCR
jgi:hypothetical protein